MDSLATSNTLKVSAAECASLWHWKGKIWMRSACQERFLFTFEVTLYITRYSCKLLLHEKRHMKIQIPIKFSLLLQCTNPPVDVAWSHTRLTAAAAQRALSSSASWQWTTAPFQRSTRCSWWSTSTVFHCGTQGHVVCWEKLNLIRHLSTSVTDSPRILVSEVTEM